MVDAMRSVKSPRVQPSQSNVDPGATQRRSPSLQTAGLLATARPSTGPIAPRNFSALQRALDENDRLIRRQLPNLDLKQLAAWKNEAVDLRLEVARQLSAIAHADELPPHHANQYSAKLAHATLLVAEVAQRELVRDDLDLLAGLLLKARQQVRGTVHNGLPADEVAPLDLSAFGIEGAGLTLTGKTPDGGRLQATRTFLDPTMRHPDWPLATVEHETVHEAQSNATLDEVDVSTQMANFSVRHAGLGASPEHARAGFLETARSLPVWRPESETDPTSGLPLARTFYLSSPWEAQAFVEQSEVVTLLADLAQAEPLGPGMLDTIKGVLPWLVQASQQSSEEMLSDSELTQRAPSAPATLRRFDSALHADAYRLAADVLTGVADLNSLAHSRGWNPTAAAALSKVIRDTIQQFERTSGLEGSAHRLEQLVDIVQGALALASQWPGVEAGTSIGPSPSPRVFADAKHRPLDSAVALAADALSIEPADVQKALAASLDEAGFMRKVQELRAVTTVGERPDPGAIGSAVNDLAAQLLGMTARYLPALATSVFDAPTAELRLVDGMNLHAGQARKMRFDASTWQLHVPVDVFANPTRLAGRLAKVAFDVAYAVDVLRQGGVDLTGTLDLGERLPNVEQKIGLTENIGQVHREARPSSAAATLRAASSQHASRISLSYVGRLFHEGPRAELKGRRQDEATAEKAADRYRTNTVMRWNDPAIALRRAIGAIADSASPP